MKPRTLGPIADLERHLPQDWWKTLFNSVYLKTDGDVVENENNTKADIDILIQYIQPLPNERLLDLCCGQGRHALELSRRGYLKVMGLDRSKYLIRLARRRSQRAGAAIKFAEGDARKIRMPENYFDVVYMMGNSFGYFEREEDDHAVLQSIKHVLTSQGRLALDLMDGAWMRTNMEARSWEWIDQSQFVCRERSLSKDHSRIISREVIVHTEKGVIADQFYGERLYDKTSICALLATLEFSDITVQHNIIPESTRGQDLGMMANRLFITAVAPVKRAVTARQSRIAVSVLLGDPRLPDAIKQHGHFAAEDIETVVRLKQALAEHKGYDFTYIDSHHHLLTQMQRLECDFVFNLCDEGFHNNATKELHIPALLEMCEIPYSGAGPDCLSLCYNKALVRALAMALDIPIPGESYFDASDNAASIPSIFPALLKPNSGDGSIGITEDAVVYSADALMRYLDYLRRDFPNRPILIQEYLSGREFSVGIIGNPGSFTILPILEVDYSQLPANLPHILPYASKWQPDSPYWKDILYKRADVNEETTRQMVDYSTKLFERTGCRDYARFDYRADTKGEIKLLEVNPNPGWCWDGKFNLMAQWQDTSYSALLELILSTTNTRLRQRPF